MSGSELAAGTLVLLLSTSAYCDRRAAGPAQAGDPAPITVPGALAARSATLEASGVAWAAPLGRYLVISDDTGQREDHHQPWLLAMTRDGAFDEAPVPVAGIDAINDAESICAGPDGTFFLVTSHSLTRKGKLPAARRLLLQLKLDGRVLRVIGRADLTTARDAAGGSLLAIAGLPDEGRLDIEAIAYSGGALYVGLKAPLTAAGAAVVLRLADPAAALRAGAIPAGAVTKQWEVPLAAGPQKAAQGIADMTALADGSFVLVANAPKGMPSDGGGALWSLRPHPGAKTVAPVLLRWFQGRRPEGVTLADDGASLIIVFDENEAAPRWLRWPLPVAGAKGAAK